MNVGVFSRQSFPSLSDARQWVYSYLLALPHAPPIVLTPKEPPKELLSWLGLSWREANLVRQTTFPDDFLYTEGGTRRLKLNKLSPLTCLDSSQQEITLTPQDPIAFQEETPSEALLLAEQAHSQQLDSLVVDSLDDDALSLFVALRQLHQQPLLSLYQPAPIEKEPALPSLVSLRKQGFVPQAIFNWLCLLCWPIPEGAWSLSSKLLWPLSALEAQPQLRFDVSKLKTFNEVYLRSLSFEELGELLVPFLEELGLWQEDHNKLHWAKLAREEISILSDVANLRYLIDCTLIGPDQVEPEALRVMKEEISLLVLSVAKEYFSTGETDFHALRSLIETRTGAKRKKLFYPLRIAITGKLYGPSFPEILPFLGAKRCLSRVSYWIDFLQSK